MQNMFSSQFFESAIVFLGHKKFSIALSLF